MIFLMKLQVAAWQFCHNGCVGTRQWLLGAPADPNTYEAWQWVPISLAEAQTPHLSQNCKTLIQNENPCSKNKHKKPATADKKKPSKNMLSKCSKMADIFNADIQNLLELLGPSSDHLHVCYRPDPALCGEALRVCLVLSCT